MYASLLGIIYVVRQYRWNLLCEGGFDSLSSDFAGSRPLSSLRLSDSVHTLQNKMSYTSAPFHYTDDECNKSRGVVVEIIVAYHALNIHKWSSKCF